MNPGSFFREVLESHEFQLSDTLHLSRVADVFCLTKGAVLQTYWT